MLARLAKVWASGSWRAAPGSRQLTHSNDTRPGVSLSGAPVRTHRRILVCRWRRSMDGGGLECRWSIELVDATPLEELQRCSTRAPGHDNSR
jgi:hypothetical protein